MAEPGHPRHGLNKPTAQSVPSGKPLTVLVASHRQGEYQTASSAENSHSHGEEWNGSPRCRPSWSTAPAGRARPRQRAGGDSLTGLAHHGDRGSVYLSIKYTDRLAEAGVVAAVGSRGDSYDNALAESTFGQIKAELVHRRCDSSDASAAMRRTLTL